MRQLLQFPPGDLVSCENWSSLKDAVSTALMDRNTELAVSGRDIHSVLCVRSHDVHAFNQTYRYCMVLYYN